MKVRDYYEVKAQTGEVGIEIELEGRKFPKTFGRYWTCKADGSLRGNSIEYVLDRPLSRAMYPKALEYLTRKQNDAGMVVNDTGNAGIHIHINVQEMTIVQVYNFICLYLMYEDLLIAFCGESREGNFFCLRTKDAEYLLKVLIDAAKQGYWEEIDGGGNVRYASINVAALRKFGSLEFRGMRSPVDNATIVLWTEMLLRLKDCAKKYKTPQDIIEAFSMDGQKYFTERVFGKYSKKIFKDYNWGERLVEGMWRAQDIAYCRDWKPLLKKEPKTKKKKNIKKDAGNWYHDRLMEGAGAQLRQMREPPQARQRIPEPNRPQWVRHDNGDIEIVNIPDDI